MLGTFTRTLLDCSDYQLDIIFINLTQIIPFFEFLRIRPLYLDTIDKGIISQGNFGPYA